MDRTCPVCGTLCDENSVFCAGCGTQFTTPQRAPRPASQRPAQRPAQRRSRASAPPASPLVRYIKRYLKFIILAVMLFSLISGIMNLFATYDVEATVSFNDEEASSEGPLSDLREDTPDELMIYVLSSYLMGIVGFAVCGMLGYTTYLMIMNAPGSKKFFGLSGLVGTIGSFIALLMALLGGSAEYMGAEMSFSVNFTYWLSVILYAGLLCVDKVLLKKRFAPLK